MDNSDIQDTITAIATPPGKGGVGIVRVSGPLVKEITKSILSTLPKPRYAHFGPFKFNDEVIDEGIGLYFCGPHSFTGEDVLELQAHGGPIVLSRLLKAVCALGARLSRPGEFSERAFLNGKVDLAQCEAIADLIDASSEQAAIAALSSLQGVFSSKIDTLVEQVIYLRMYVEAAIDFPEEEVDFLSDGKILSELDGIIEQTNAVLKSAREGAKLRSGIKVALMGKPNVGKSSLLNALSGDEVAIVSNIAGTTRDWVKEDVHLDGFELQLIDTAGMRQTDDTIEQLGIERSHKAGHLADKVLLVVDANEAPFQIYAQVDELVELGIKRANICVVLNKSDLLANGTDYGYRKQDGLELIYISASTGKGIDLLKDYLKGIAGKEQPCVFTARARHVNAIEESLEHLLLGREQLTVSKAGELLAEELRMVQASLGSITGKFTTDDLLGRIFSTFCMGK